jgi:maltose O-acetyltransferase
MKLVTKITKGIKHLAWNLVIFSLDFIPLNIIKSNILRYIFLFKIGSESSIHVGFRFYRLGQICIGKNSVLNRNCTIDNRGAVTIGAGVSISRQVSIYTAGHFHDNDFKMWTDQVEICDSCVIYSHSIILPGVKLRKGCIVYPGSVVYRGDYPEGSILPGNPAYVIRKTDTNAEREHDYPHLYGM